MKSMGDRRGRTARAGSPVAVCVPDINDGCPKANPTRLRGCARRRADREPSTQQRNHCVLPGFARRCDRAGSNNDRWTLPCFASAFSQVEQCSSEVA